MTTHPSRFVRLAFLCAIALFSLHCSSADSPPTDTTSDMPVTQRHIGPWSPPPNESFLPEVKPAVPRTTPIIVDHPAPLDYTSVSATFARVSDQRQAVVRGKWDKSRSAVITISATPATPGGGSGIRTVPVFGGNIELWLLGEIRYGTDSTAHVVTFDVPLNSSIVLPVSGEYFEVFVRLILPQTANTDNTGPTFSNPEDPTMIAGNIPLETPFTVTGIMSEGSVSPSALSPVRTRRELIAATSTFDVAIPFGVNGAMVYGDATAGSNWSWVVQGAIVEVIGPFPLNGSEPIPVPPNATGIRLNNADAVSHTYLVVNSMGI